MDVPSALIEAGASSLFATQIRPDSVLVVECPYKLTKDGYAHLQEVTKALFPDQAVLILDGGMSLKVLHRPELPEPTT